MYQFKTLLYSTITILFNLLFISKSYALGINDLKIQKLHDFEYAWGMDLIDNENLLVSEKKGVLSIYNFSNGKIVGKETYNDVLSKRQGGLLDIIFVKDKEKKYVFSCYQNLNSDLIVARHELKNFKFFNKKIIFSSKYKSKSGVHFGCRFINYKNSILFSIGDRGDRNNSQNSKNYPGSIIKMDYEGNHKIAKEGWLSGIFSMGHRNPQGLIYIKEFDEIWSHEHGPKGGDEINIVEMGNNYGWPIVTYGKEYWGGKIGVSKPVKGYEEPIWKWIPSIAPSGMAYYNNDYFKFLKNKILVGSLKFKTLYIVNLNNKRPHSEIKFLKNKIGRIRDVLVHPKGHILLINDERDGGLFKLDKY